MATIKSYSDLQQSKKLAKILPIESADMTYIGGELIPYPYCESKFKGEDNVYPAWSLASLLGVLPGIHLKKYIYDGITKYYTTLIGIRQVNSEHYDNPVDACYEMVIRLNELNLL